MQTTSQPPLPQERAFIRKGRQAAHQVLFFTGLLHRTGHGRTDAQLEAAAASVTEQIRALVACVGFGVTDGDAQRNLRGYPEWENLRAALHQTDRLNLDAVAWVHATCVQFLRATRPGGWRGFAGHIVPSTVRILRRHLSLIVASGVVLAVTSVVEQVEGLLRTAWPMTALFCLSVLLPLILIRAFAYRRFSTTGRVYRWDIGLGDFDRPWDQAVPPERGIVRYPDEQLPRLIGQGILRRLVFTGGIWLASFTVLAVDRYGELGVLSRYAAYTVFLILSLHLIILGVARLLDFWDYLVDAPIRLYLMTASIAVFVLANLPAAGSMMVAVLAALAGLHVITWVRRRMAGVATLSQLVLGIAFALAATLGVLSNLADGRNAWRHRPGDPERIESFAQSAEDGDPIVVMAASGGGSRAAVYTAMTLEALHREHRAAACALRAISSVSGGSLANAVYVSRRLNGPQCATFSPEPGWLVDAVAADFLEPTIVGFLLPWTSRGEAIEAAWRDGSGLGTTTIGELATTWRARPGSFPIPLFNTSTLDPHAVVISPLQASAYTPRGLSEEADDPTTNQYDRWSRRGVTDPTWVYYRDGIYALEHLVGAYDPPLAAAVRASANFPFGFPLVHLETPSRLRFSPAGHLRRRGQTKHVYLTDGGVLSNSGMWTLYQLLSRAAEADDELRRRGVLLVMVEASRMPEHSAMGKVSALSAAISNQNPVGQNLHRHMLDALSEQLGGRFIAVQIDLPPSESRNVMTTWALPKAALDDLHTSFADQWQDAGPRIGGAWTELRAGEPIARREPWRRPPLD